MIKILGSLISLSLFATQASGYASNIYLNLKTFEGAVHDRPIEM
jgi:hypothetical protein